MCHDSCVIIHVHDKISLSKSIICKLYKRPFLHNKSCIQTSFCLIKSKLMLEDILKPLDQFFFLLAGVTQTTKEY